MSKQKITFNVTVRARTGKGGAREARRLGFVPGVLYGGGEAPVAINLKTNEVDWLERKDDRFELELKIVPFAEAKQFIETTTKSGIRVFRGVAEACKSDGTCSIIWHLSAVGWVSCPPWS